ncbi:uncharacterized protein SPSC_03036 [Sporisorium scitamineum]|uniref:DUF7719 domain-containing protein n=1 Tax=Sporisorium scitamineum TaxID=49012 RepID=A0A0F7S3X4_9BASI|nr:hypothetical protein [Sporisorium scitamineum]CDS82216.1 uncharacterized protein SPSC_03036 [Sporisorium scitamineum]
MARLTEIQDGSDSEDVRAGSSCAHKRAGLTQDEQEQILHKSGLIEKLGLPKDFITMDESQAQLDALNRSRATRGAGTDDDDSEDDYGVASDHERDGDDTANRLMQEQQATEMSSQVESILDLVIWTMPFGFMYTLLDVLVRQQYGETVGVSDEAVRLIRALPVLAFFIHFTLTSQRQALIQSLLFIICSACGCALIYIVNKSPYDVVVQRVAPLGTLWIFSVVRLDLMPACISLAITAVFVKQTQLKIIFE